MNDSQAARRGRVVPKWVEYKRATKGHDLSSERKRPFKLNEKTKNSIEEEYKEFKENENEESACSLLGTAFLFGEDHLAEEMSHFLIGRQGVSKITLDLANRVLALQEEDSLQPIDNIISRIASLKEWTRNYPRDAIAWIELARLYTIKNQIEKARHAVDVALTLAPCDRYVVRCATRYFLHIHDYEAAWHYILRATSLSSDPWLKSTEINVAQIYDKKIHSKFYLPKDPDHNELFHYSELFESVGNLELGAGNEKRARKLFRTAWKNPCDTVITHAEWVLRNKLPGLRERTKLEFEKSLEAHTWVHYSQLDIERALSLAREWELDEPYSTYPTILGSSIASHADKHKEAIAFARRGLQIKPDDEALNNNICYALLRTGLVDDAEKFIVKLKTTRDSRSDLCITATRGLFEFKKNNIKAGRGAYLKVLDKCRKNKEYELFCLASLNLALCELEAKTLEAEKTAKEALDVSKRATDPDNRLLRGKVKEELLAYKLTPARQP